MLVPIGTGVETRKENKREIVDDIVLGICVHSGPMFLWWGLQVTAYLGIDRGVVLAPKSPQDDGSRSRHVWEGLHLVI